MPLAIICGIPMVTICYVLVNVSYMVYILIIFVFAWVYFCLFYLDCDVNRRNTVIRCRRSGNNCQIKYHFLFEKIFLKIEFSLKDMGIACARIRCCNNANISGALIFRCRKRVMLYKWKVSLTIILMTNFMKDVLITKINTE